jgi:hypothetical protein
LVFSPPGTHTGVRTMYTLYWLAIVGGLVLWLTVGLVVD